MSQKPNYREQIDACRPGSDDLSLPALAELAQVAETVRAIAHELARSQHFDRAVSAAMHDVPLPAGLFERLEAKLAEANDSEAADSTGEVDLPPAPARFSRRLVLTSAGLATAAAIVLAVASQFWSPAPRRFSQNHLTTEVESWIESSPLNSPTWEPATQPAPIALLVPAKKPQVRSFVTSNGEKAIAYDLTPAGGQQVLLFVIKTRHVYGVRTSPYTPLTSASGGMGGMALGAWQKDGTLYVLAVREDRLKLHHFIREQRHAALPSSSAAPHS